MEAVWEVGEAEKDCTMLLPGKQDSVCTYKVPEGGIVIGDEPVAVA